MPHPAHAFDRRTIGSAAHAWDFNLQPQQLQAGGTVFDPIVAAGQVITDAAQQVFADAPKLHVVDLPALFGFPHAHGDLLPGKLVFDGDGLRAVFLLSKRELHAGLGFQVLPLLYSLCCRLGLELFQLQDQFLLFRGHSTARLQIVDPLLG